VSFCFLLVFESRLAKISEPGRSEWNPTSGRYGIRTNGRPLEKTGEAIGELNDKLGRKGAKSSHPIETAILISPRRLYDFNRRRKAG
jgi:hypothetical protein